MAGVKVSAVKHSEAVVSTRPPRRRAACRGSAAAVLVLCVIAQIQPQSAPLGDVGRIIYEGTKPDNPSHEYELRTAVINQCRK